MKVHQIQWLDGRFIKYWLKEIGSPGFTVSVSPLWSQALSAALKRIKKGKQRESSEDQPLLHRQTVHQALELLVAQLDFVLQLALFDDERRLHLDKVLVVRQRVLGQVAAQDVVDEALAAVQVLLELLGVLVLSDQQLPLLHQRALQ